MNDLNTTNFVGKILDDFKLFETLIYYTTTLISLRLFTCFAHVSQNKVPLKLKHTLLKK